MVNRTIKKSPRQPVMWAYEIQKWSRRFMSTLRTMSCSKCAVDWTSGYYNHSIITMLLSSVRHYCGSHIIVTLLRGLLIPFITILFLLLYK